MQRLGVSGAVRPMYGSLGVKRVNLTTLFYSCINYMTDSRSRVNRLYVHVEVFIDAQVSNIIYTCMKDRYENP